METEGKYPINWENVDAFLLACGSAESPDALAMKIVDNIGLLCEFDAASTYLMDAQGNVTGKHLRNIDERWIKIYLAYYMHTDNSRFSLSRASSRLLKEPPYVNNYEWANEPSAEFVPDFIRVRKLTYSCGFGLYDASGHLRLAVALDKKGTENFTPQELYTLRRTLPHLNSLHRNFYYSAQPSGRKIPQELKEQLTVRESEIAALLCRSMSPAQISGQLHIAQSTTYKHISNIYEKLNVSSQRELLALLLNREE